MHDEKRGWRVIFGWRWLLIILVGAPPAWGLGGDTPVNDQMMLDGQALAQQAPGLPGGSLFAGFGNQESVSLVNGNLVVAHPSSSFLSMDGGGSFGLRRTYNSKHADGESIEVECTNGTGWEAETTYTPWDGWSGRGWTSHLGRLFERSIATGCGYAEGSGCSLVEWTMFGGRQLILEESDGTQLVVAHGMVGSGQSDGFPLPGYVHPRLRVEYFGTTALPCASNPYVGTGPEKVACGGTVTGAPYYRVTWPDGRRLRLESIVAPAVDTVGGHVPAVDAYVTNGDRNGWYATRVEDALGNGIDVTYERSGNYPEAIREIRHVHADGTVASVTTELWTQADADMGLTAQLNVGKLKSSSSPVPGGIATMRFEYGTWGQLLVVELPETPSGNPTGQITYTYPGTYQPLGGIVYPTGGSVRYTYKDYVAGEYRDVPKRWEQECFWDNARMWDCSFDPQDGTGYDQCMDAHRNNNHIWRKERGVASRTVYPEGEGTGAPSATWRWERFLGRDFEHRYGSGEEKTSVFRRCDPPSRLVAGDPEPWGKCEGSSVEQAEVYGRAQSEMDGCVARNCFDLMDGQILKTSWFDGAGVMVRSESMEYEGDDLGLQERSRETAYSDYRGFSGGGDACFLASDAGGDPTIASSRTMTRRFALPNAELQYRMSVVEGEFIKGGGRRVEYRRIEDAATTPSLPGASARASAHILGAFDDFFVEEQGRRLERQYQWDGAGRIVEHRSENLFGAPSTTFSNPLVPGVQRVALSDDGNVAASLAHLSPGGMISSISYGGGDPSPGSTTPASFTLAFGVQKGRVASSWFDANPALGWKLSDLTLDVSGLATQSRARNGLRTGYAWDALGRLTSITPLDAPERPQRVVYPDLRTTRFIRSQGSETAFNAGDPGQTFTEQRYDGLGRTVEVRTARPDGTVALVLTRHDQMGRTIFVSEALDAAAWDAGTTPRVNWSDGANYSVTVPTSASGTPLGTTTFYGVPSATEPQNPLKAAVDGLGRVRKVVRADGSATDTRYCGPHKEVTTTVGTTPSLTRYYSDGLGRLVVVDVEAGAQNPTGVDAVYDYDLLGNLTKVNLVTNLPPDPFTAWKNSSIPDGQVRLFEYDALGRLRKSRIPEAGEGQGANDADWTWYDRYDALGNLLAWRDPLAAKRGYYFRNEYDSAGRLTKSEKRLGTPGSTAVSDEQRLGSGTSNRGDFNESSDVGSGAWEVGWINGTTFTSPNGAHPAAWRRVTYPYPSSGSCLNAPPNAPSGGGLYLGESCSYSSVDGNMQVARINLTGVRKDDLLSFSYWRQLRENTIGDKDVFEVFVVLNPSGGSTNDISSRRTAFRLTSKQSSLATWQRVVGLQLGALYSDAEWAEGGDTGQVKSLYLYVAFSKGDAASTGVGTGLVLDEVSLGRPGTETLVANSYDIDACFNGAPEACDSGAPNNAFLGNLTKSESYQDGRLVSSRMNAYQGLNGRLSANRISVDWAGVGQTTNFLTKMSYDSSGALQYQTNPYLPNVDAGRTYEFGYRRDQFDGVREAGGVNFVPFGGTHVVYNVAGGLAELTFNNGVSTVIGTEAEQMYRPRSFTVQTAGGASVYWSSGTYQYDPSGNITAIGGQTFSYDLAGRLVNAQMLPQATAPTESTPNTVSFAFDPYGNIKTQDWSSSNPTRSAPLFMEFAARQYGPSGTVSRNRITDPDFDYDINGNLRKSNSGGLKHTMLWDARNRMTSVQTGLPGDSAGTTLEARYSYDASGYRTITNPDSGDGKPVVSLRDGSGQLIADYVYSPASARLILEKDYVYGLGQLLVERRRTSAPPTQATQSSLSSGGNYNMSLTSGTGASSYTMDIRGESGGSSQISNIIPDAQGNFTVPETSLIPDTTNLLRIKKNTGEAEPYSAPVSIVYSTGVTSQSVNTVRAISVHRNGTNLVIRWSLAAADGKLTKVHFDRADGGGLVPLNPTALPAGVSSLTVSDQALAAPCGDFRIERIVPGQSSGTMTEFGVGMPPSSSSQNLTIGNGGGCGEDPPPPPPGGGGGPAPYTLADSFHHRDHLGNLRIETDSAGLVMRDSQGTTEIGRHDYYPFGTEMTADLGVGSRKRFTGHERDEATGFDYMLARHSAPAQARFTSVDPLASSARLHSPQSWNRYAYTISNPTNLVDPTGQAPSTYNNALPEERAVLRHAANALGTAKAIEIGFAAVNARVDGKAFAEAYNGGPFDDSTAPNAIQHATATCQLAVAVGQEYAKAFTDAHEVGDRFADPQAREMDLANNSVGLDLASLAESPAECGPLAVMAYQAGGLTAGPNAVGSPTPLLDAAATAPLPPSPPPPPPPQIDIRR